MDMRRTAACVVVAALAAVVVVATAASMPGPAYAQDDGSDGPIPAWIKSVFAFYIEGQITDEELIAALEYLIGQGVIEIAAAPDGQGDVRADVDPERARHAAWAADEAEFNDALAKQLGDGMRDFRLELRSGYMPGTAADYADVIDAGRAEIRAVESYAAALRAAAADGEISDEDRASIEAAGRAVDDAGQALESAVAASPMGAYLEFQEGLMAAFAGALDDGHAGGPVPSEPTTCPTPSELAARAAPDDREADEVADDAGYIDDLAQQRRQHLRDFEAGLSGAYTFRANGDFGSAGSSAAGMADGDISAYDDMLDAIKDAIRAAERQADVMERAAKNGVISADESSEIAMATAATGAAECSAAAEYDATPAARNPYGVFSAYMNGFR